MNNYILSICIPTYNMGEYLEELVLSINEQLTEKSKILQICISDNASTDNTESIVKKLRLKYANIVYHKNEVNEGADRNFLKAVEISNGTYSWLMGADDKVEKDAIKVLLEYINDNPDIDIFLGDRINFSMNNKMVGEEYWGDKSYRVDKNNLSEYILNAPSIGAIFSYISSIIFKKKSWDISIKSLEKKYFIGTMYVHSAILLNILKTNGYMLYLHQIIVITKRDNDSFLLDGYLNRINVDYNYLTIVKKLFGEESKEYISIKILLTKERTILHFLKAKLSEKDVQNVIDFMKKNNLKNIVIVKYMPKFIIKALLSVYEILNFKRYSK